MMMLEGGLTLIAVAVIFALPQLGNRWFASIERILGRLARTQGLAVLCVGLATILVRLAVLPLRPIPLPFLPDDFSLMLASDTFAHGRLTNPTPAMWMHFESVHIDMLPTYQSMYFPAQGLVMAAGKVLFGNPWFGILISSALMCAAICWMLQAWLPPGWALLGGALAVLRLGLFSYWTDSYTGGGPISALAGALVLGTLPRLMKTARMRYGLLMAVGIVLLIINRPYEGMLLCIPVAIVLGRWIYRGKNRPAPAVLLRRAVLPVLLIVAGTAWLGYYDYRAFGSPTTLPYSVNRAAYAMAPYYVWQAPRPEPAYRHEGMRRFYHISEMEIYSKVHSWALFLPMNLAKILEVVLFFAGYLLIPPLFMIRRVFLDRRVRFFILSVLFLMAGMVIEIYLIPHYVAPFTVAFYVIGLQAMRHLRVWNSDGRPYGRTLVRLLVTCCVVLTVVRIYAIPFGFKVQEWPASSWSIMWYGPDQYGTERAQIAAGLEKVPGQQLVIVRESADRDSHDQWIYNDADIDASKVVWAREMDAANNLELIRYYANRKPWLINLATEPATVSPYPVPVQSSAATH